MDEDKIYEQACIRLGWFSVSGETVTLEPPTAKDGRLLKEFIRKAVADCTERRDYPVSYTADMIADDIVRFEDTALEVAIYDWNKQGAEGESSHNENSTYRSFESRRSIVRQIKPITKVVS